MKNFNENQILSDEGLLIKIQEIDDEANLRKKSIYDEIDRRSKEKTWYFIIFGEYSLEGYIWINLVKSGGAHGFDKIFRFAGGSREKLRAVLRELGETGLVMRVGMKYQAVSPDWFQVNLQKTN